MLRNLNADTGVVKFAITAIALPAAPIGFFAWIGVGRHYERCAGIIDLVKAWVALPAIAV